MTELPVEDHLIDELHSKGSIKLELEDAPNSYFILRSTLNPKHSTIARYSNGKLFPLRQTKGLKYSIEPKDLRQKVFYDSLQVEDILVSVATGMAGSGKTTLALAYACQKAIADKKTIYLCKPATMVGKGTAFGPIPGDIKEKYDPFLASYKIVLNKLGLTKDHLDLMIKKEQIQFIPVEFARGCTYEDCVFILDEAQNLPWHDFNTIVSRMGEKTKLIILGDLNQIDNRLSKTETGLYKFVSSTAFRKSDISVHVELLEQYRGKICNLIYEVDKELKGERSR